MFNCDCSNRSATLVKKTIGVLLTMAPCVDALTVSRIKSWTMKRESLEKPPLMRIPHKCSCPEGRRIVAANWRLPHSLDAPKFRRRLCRQDGGEHQFAATPVRPAALEKFTLQTCH